MKKFFLMLAVAAFSAQTMSAQTVLESKNADNWYIGIYGGVDAPAKGYKVLKNINPEAGVRIGRWFTPVVGLVGEGTFRLGDKPGEFSKTFVKSSNVSLLGTLNFNNWFSGYPGEPRSFEVIGVAGMGWEHLFGTQQAPNASGEFNALTSKEAFFNAIVNERAWEFGSEALRKFDLVRWNLYAKKIEEAMYTALCWGIACNDDLMNDPTVLSTYPEAVNYTTWANKLWYAKVGKNNRKSDIKWYNQKYKITEDDATMTAAGWQSVNWGSNMLKRTRTYLYGGKDYGTATPVKVVNGDGSTTYTLGTAPNTQVVTVAAGESTGITRKDVYTASDYFTRLYRGYSNGALKGNGVVPYLLPITTETISASSVLNNDGYHILDMNMQDGVNVEVATIEHDYK